MTENSFDEWTPEERAQLADVGRHRSARSELKGRTSRVLRDRGLIGGAAQQRPRWSLALGLAAAIVIFAVGMLAGYGVGSRREVVGPRDSMAGGGGTLHEVARLDSPSTQAPIANGGRHVIWF